MKYKVEFEINTPKQSKLKKQMSRSGLNHMFVVA